VAAAVVDASALVDFLLTGSPVARSALADTDPFAPELIDAEVLNAVTRLARGGSMTEERAELAIRRLARASIERVPIAPLLLEAWALRHNVGSYDALYVALARRLECPLITADRRLASAPALGVPLIMVRQESSE
jgi:predicted nucleic acid-binding protein